MFSCIVLTLYLFFFFFLHLMSRQFNMANTPSLDFPSYTSSIYTFDVKNLYSFLQGYKNAGMPYNLQNTLSCLFDFILLFPSYWPLPPHTHTKTTKKFNIS